MRADVQRRIVEYLLLQKMLLLLLVHLLLQKVKGRVCLVQHHRLAHLLLLLEDRLQITIVDVVAAALHLIISLFAKDNIYKLCLHFLPSQGDNMRT